MSRLKNKDKPNGQHIYDVTAGLERIQKKLDKKENTWEAWFGRIIAIIQALLTAWLIAKII